jgi:hypothetical protein
VDDKQNLTKLLSRIKREAQRKSVKKLLFCHVFHVGLGEQIESNYFYDCTVFFVKCQQDVAQFTELLKDTTLMKTKGKKKEQPYLYFFRPPDLLSCFLRVHYFVERFKYE